MSDVHSRYRRFIDHQMFFRIWHISYARILIRRWCSIGRGKECTQIGYEISSLLSRGSCNHPSVERELQKDIGLLRTLAFKRVERCSSLLERFHGNRPQIDAYPSAPLIWRVYDWLCTPLSLWPIDFEGLASHLLGLFEAMGQVEDDVLLLLDILGDPPGEKAQITVAGFEHVVESGNYDHLLKTPEKFEEGENAIRDDEQLGKAWEQIKGKWDVAKLRNPHGVIRRRLSQERNMRSEWQFEWQDDQKKFQLFFDAMCYRWKLYGMENDKPLLLKVTVNPTPHGTMIMIPRHLSVDPVRDLNWTEIRRLHRSRGATRQGRKLSRNRMQSRKESLQVKKYWDEAGEKRIRGSARYDYVHKRMKKDGRMDHSWVNRHLRTARRILAQK